MAKPKAIPFWLLYQDSLFTIHSEPSRGIDRSNDTRTYRKVCDAYSVQVSPETGEPCEPEKVAILRPNDLVIPASRPRAGGNTRNTNNHHHTNKR